MGMALKSNQHDVIGVLKTVDFVTTACQYACERWVDIVGLKTIFSYFTSKEIEKNRKADERQKQYITERSLSILFNLFQNLAKDSRRDCVYSKFVEKEFEGCERLVELMFEYRNKLLAAETGIYKRCHELNIEEDTEEVLLSLMARGLFHVRQAAITLAH